MDPGDVGPGHLGHAVIAERRDNAVQHPPVALGRARFQTERYVFLIETLRELFNRDGLSARLALDSRIVAVSAGGEDGDRLAARLLTSQDGAWSEADAAGSPASAVLNDVALAATWEDAQPETGKVAVPDEIVARLSSPA